MAVERVYRVEEAAKLIGYSYNFILGAIQSGRLRAKDIGTPGKTRHTWIITESAIAEFLGAKVIPESTTTSGKRVSSFKGAGPALSAGSVPSRQGKVRG